MVLFCRTCMCHIAAYPHTTPMSYHIFETTNFADKLIKCSSLRIDPFDNYPSWICNKCYDKVMDFWEFQEMCRKSIDKFNEMLKREAEAETMNVLDVLSCVVNPLADNEQTAAFLTEEYAAKNPLDVSGELPNTMTKQTTRLRKTRNNKMNVSRNNHVMGEQEDSEAVAIKVMPIRKVKMKLPMEDINSADRKLDINLGNDETSSLSDSYTTSSVKTSLCRMPFKCKICAKQFSAQHRFEAHQRKHEGLPPYPCSHEGCDSSFMRWHYYQAHLKQHTGSNQLYKCEINYCERVYKNKSALNIHKRKYHNCGPELKTHMCEICGKVFKGSAILNDHRFTHVEKSQLPYICEEEGCTKRFSNKEKLKIHRMRHAGIKNFICPHCGMRKTTRNELKIHINYHTLERTWPCRFCAKVCNSAGNLKMHVRNIHERAKDFACRYCDRTFAKADTKKYHEMTHTGEKPHSCDVCERRFLQPAALRTHRKIHLKEKSKTEAAATVKITTVLGTTSVEDTDLFSAEHDHVKELSNQISGQNL